MLSPSTASFDRGDKFNRYRLLESLTDYVLIAVDRVRVEHHTRLKDGTWRLAEYHRSSDAVPLVSLSCELPLIEIYEKLTLPPPVP